MRTYYTALFYPTIVLQAYLHRNSSSLPISFAFQHDLLHSIQHKPAFWQTLTLLQFFTEKIAHETQGSIYKAKEERWRALRMGMESMYNTMQTKLRRALQNTLIS